MTTAMSEKKDPFAVYLGVTIKQARLAAGIRLTDLARMSGMQVSNLSSIENGHRVAGHGAITRIAAALNRRVVISFVDTNKKAKPRP